MGTARPEPSRPLAQVVARNIASLLELRLRADRLRTPTQRAADAITRFAGSIGSVVVHAIVFGGWLLVNSGVVPGLFRFDPPPFVGLAMFASVEAIFLTSFVLVSQNRMASIDERRAELDLQIDLLAEHEVTRLVQLVEAIARRLDIDIPVSEAELAELKRDVDPTHVVEELDKAHRGDNPSGQPQASPPGHEH